MLFYNLSYNYDYKLLLLRILRKIVIVVETKKKLNHNKLHNNLCSKLMRNISFTPICLSIVILYT